MRTGGRYAAGTCRGEGGRRELRGVTYTLTLPPLAEVAGALVQGAATLLEPARGEERGGGRRGDHRSICWNLREVRLVAPHRAAPLPRSHLLYMRSTSMT